MSSGPGRSAQGVYQQPHPFELLDEFINNGDPAPVSAFHADLEAVLAGPDPESANYGPFAGDTVMQTHWSGDWTDPEGYGGAYWPYLTSVNIHTLLTDALIKSIGAALGTSRKQHTTIWAPILIAPESGNANNLTESDQEDLFKVAVHETPNSVQLLIVTPEV